MTSTGRQLQQNQRLRTWPFRKRAAVPNENTKNTLDCKMNLDSQLELRYRESIKSIFMTDSSKTIELSERNVSPSRISTTTSMNSGNVKTTFHKKSSDAENRSDCPICCDSFQSAELKQMPCCSIKLCSSCLLTHTMTNINNRKMNIECPACLEEIDSTSILYNSELPVAIRQLYQQILAQDLAEKQDTFIKLCPHCNFITILNENDPVIRGKKSRRSSQEWILCQQCDKEWCWPCYAPAHPDQTCRQFNKIHSHLDRWAKTRRSDNKNQRNAQRCPKCSIYIEKVDGCDHMVCTKCNSKFCYRCGSRMRVPFYVGHDAKYSIFGCKYKLWPNRPLLRWLTRGAVFVSVILLTPVVLSALIALVAIGIPTVLIVGCFALPVFVGLECKRRS